MKNLFQDWDNLKKQLNGRYIILFLDYDGTLAPIADTPGKAFISQEARDLLGALSKKPRCKLAVISGRALKDIKNMVGLRGIIYSGNHGLEIEGPKIKFRPSVPPRYKASLKQIKEGLNKGLSSINGVFVEDKGLSLSLHYRLADKARIPQIKTIFHETVIFYAVRGKVSIKPGKMVLEVRPPVRWDKGKVVLWLLARQIFASGKDGTLPVYIGDDVTDEDAFKALRNKGLTIFVGRPKKSYARYYLKNPGEVMDFLRKISRII